MHHPLPDIQRDERYSQDDIETLFDTGFGYRISGINVRNDDDDISGETFTYVGEGVPEKGDQSADTLGNSALIAAESNPVPIYFFYKESDADGWASQGLVDVEKHELVYDADGNREVLEFTISHRAETAAGTACEEIGDQPPS
ncbi:MAG: hypothetical protein V5A38_12915 [Halolamina sp.]|uniref:hypothetical protein n=1 Tax=Halolamina sp. TaxID=1940283 RepID=UPI002FC354DE